MDTSPLLCLPRELRDEIYSFAVIYPEGVTFAAATASDNGSFKLQYPHHLLAITKTCKQIREESLEYLETFYSGRLCHRRRIVVVCC